MDVGSAGLVSLANVTRGWELMTFAGVEVICKMLWQTVWERVR